MPRGTLRGHAADGLDDVRRAQHAAVGDRRVGGAHLDRRDRDALADRQVAHRGARVLRQRQHDAALLAGEVDAGRLAEAELAHPVVEALGLQLLADLDRADVAGDLEDVARRAGDPGPRVRLADLAVGDVDRRREAELRVRRDQPVLQRAGDRERLERRARLVGRADGAVLLGVVGRGAGRVGVHARPVGEREDRAVARVHHERGRALRPPLLADLGEHLLGAVLDVGVEREAHALARLGRLDVAHLDRLAERVLDEAPLAVGAADHVVERVLEAGQALAVGAGHAEQLRGHPVARVDAAELGDELEPLDAQLLRAARLRGRAPCARGRRSRCRAARACAAARPRAGRAPRRAAAAAFGASLIRYGVAAIVDAGWETASSTPRRSVIAPRRAGTTTSDFCWVAAARLSDGPRTTPSQPARAAPKASRTRKTPKSSPIRRSTSATGYPCGAVPPAAVVAAAVWRPPRRCLRAAVVCAVWRPRPPCLRRWSARRGGARCGVRRSAAGAAVVARRAPCAAGGRAAGAVVAPPGRCRRRRLPEQPPATIPASARGWPSTCGPRRSVDACARPRAPRRDPGGR